MKHPLHDHQGKLSTTRLAVFLVVLPIMVVYITHNIVAMAKGTGYVSLGVNEVYLLAIALGAKVAQRYRESQYTKEKSDETT